MAREIVVNLSSNGEYWQAHSKTPQANAESDL